MYFEDHIGNKCSTVCFIVSILGKYYIYMYCNGLPNKLTLLAISNADVAACHIVIILERKSFEAQNKCYTHPYKPSSEIPCAFPV